MKRNRGISTLILLGMLCATLAFVPQTLATDDARDESWRKLDRMIQSNNVTDDQITLIRHLLQEQRSMIDLFENHGLLSETALQSTVRDILETTQFKINCLFNAEQREHWRERTSKVIRRAPVRGRY